MIRAATDWRAIPLADSGHRPVSGSCRRSAGSS